MEKIKGKAVSKPKAETANRIKANITRIVNMQPGCIAVRINNVGIWDAEKKIYRKSQTAKGVADVFLCVRGLYCEIEVKAGKDKASVEQLQRQQEVRRAKGVYEFVGSTDEFVALFNKLLSDVTAKN